VKGVAPSELAALTGAGTDDGLLPPREKPTYPLTAKITGKPHVALFHGTAGNETIIRFQMKRFIDLYKDEFDISVVEAPRCMINNFHPRVREMRPIFGKHVILREWLESSMTEALTYSKAAWGMQRTDERLKKLDKKVDFVIGFSAGAQMASLMAARQMVEPRSHAPFRGIVMLCPPVPRSFLAGGINEADTAAYFAEPLDIPVFMTHAEKDDIVGREGADEFAKLFSNVDRASHAEDHRPLPEASDAQDRLCMQIREFIRKHS